jgi:hypothetical protein
MRVQIDSVKARCWKNRRRAGGIKLVAAGILPAVSGGFQPPGRGPGAFSSGETPGLVPTERGKKMSRLTSAATVDEKH